MDDLSIEEVFTSAGVNCKSHSLAACRNSDYFVYASGGQVVVQGFPETQEDVVHVSKRYHKGPVTVLKRVSTDVDSSVEGDWFVSGGGDGGIVLYEVSSAHPAPRCLVTLDGITGPIGALSGIATSDKVCVAASWVSDFKFGLRVWWINRSNDQLSISHFFDIDYSSILAVAIDLLVLPNGAVLLAVGTTKGTVELHCETPCGQSMKHLLSISAHNDWIHSMAFNHSTPTLLATAGQDSYVKLWRIEEYVSSTDIDEISVTKNRFTVVGAGNDLHMMISAEAVLSGHDDWVQSTVWDRTGRTLLTSSSDKTLIVWKEANELWNDTVRLGIVGGQAAGFYNAVFSSDSRKIVASTYFGGLYSWVTKNDEQDLWEAVPLCSGHVGEIRDIAWHPHGRWLFSVGADRTTRVYIKQKHGKFVEIARPQVHGHSMQCMAVVSSSTIVTGAEEKIFRAFQAPRAFATSVCNITGYQMEELFGPTTFEHFGARVPALGLSNKAIEESEAVVSEAGGDAHWEEGAFQAAPVELHAPPTEDSLQQNTLWPEIHKLYSHGHDVYAVAVNPAGTVLATSCKASHPDDAAIALWDTSDWSKKSEVSGHQLTVTQIEWSPDGTRLLSVGRDRKAILYRERDGGLNGFNYENVWMSSKEHSRIIWSCNWFRDSVHFVTASRDMRVIVWACDGDTAVPMHLFKCSLPTTAVAVCGGPELSSSILAVGLQDGSLIFLKPSGSELQLISKIYDPAANVDSAVARLRVDPSDAYQLAVAGNDGKLRVLRLKASSSA
ncbi:hypothetical protein Q1695_013985 [Nippostrongylus brasiliensis]|nr:hypothetical protein Q1695_013985 [Nippostrongylus brasiliensis]